MSRSMRYLAVLLCLALALPALAQMASQGDICTIVLQKPKPGMTAQYEAGRKKHMGWHKAQGDKWTWFVNEIMTGDDTGGYIVGSCGHTWAEMDGRLKFDDADTKDANASMGAYMASDRVSYYALRRDLSLNPEPFTTPFLSVVHFMVNPDGVPAFNDGVRKVNEGIKKTNYPVPPSQWYVLANGGQGPHYVLVQARANYASMQPPEKSLDQMMADAYGKDEGASILKSLRSSYRTSYSELLRARNDLSYMPGAGGAAAEKPKAATPKKTEPAAAKPPAKK